MHTQAEVGQVGATDGNRPGAAQPFDDGCVGAGDGVGKGQDRLGGRRAGEVDVLLDGERHAVQRAEVVATDDRPVGRVSGGAGLVVEAADDGVEGRVDVVDAS